MRTAFGFVFILASFLLTGCITQTGQSTTQLASNFINRQHVMMATKETYPPKNPKHIALYTKEAHPLTPYRVIGIATVSKYNLMGRQRAGYTLHEMMKKLAASVGGDALINISESEDNIQGSIVQFQRILI